MNKIKDFDKLLARQAYRFLRVKLLKEEFAKVFSLRDVLILNPAFAEDKRNKYNFFNQNYFSKLIDKVERFWNENPLFKNDPQFDENFYKMTDETYFNYIFSSQNDLEKKIFLPKFEDNTLDLGCGTGFWTNFFYELGVKKITAVDLSKESIDINKKRFEYKKNNISFHIQNCENLHFENETFDHVNCQGVVHHTPNTQKAINEIFRVLKRGGKASISVYYKNFLLRNYNYLYPVIKILIKYLGKNLGRGRDINNLPKDVDDFVRTFDGIDNPIGKSYTRQNFILLLREAGFKNIELDFFFFPIRFLKIKNVKIVNKIATFLLPFHVVANLHK